MLRLYKPIEHEIFELNDLLKHLVCCVWCEADGNTCDSKFQDELKPLLSYSYKKRPLKDEINKVYLHFRGFSVNQKKSIEEAFENTNEIEKLCNGELSPVYLDTLPSIVKLKIKPLFKWFYEELLNKTKVAGDKLDYYKKLINTNDFYYCPCCGIIKFESTDLSNQVREAYDHYLPKSEYPFASVNFKNLVPLCYKCNSDRKKAKDPIQKGQKAFYPFSAIAHILEINLNIAPNQDLDKLQRKDLNFEFVGDKDKIQTWKWLFEIEERYNDTIREFSKSFLRKLKRKHDKFKEDNENWTYLKTLEHHIDDYKYDEFEDVKFLRIAYLKELKNRKDLIEVYD